MNKRTTIMDNNRKNIVKKYYDFKTKYAYKIDRMKPKFEEMVNIMKITAIR